MMKKIMILGAGLLQLPAIVTAREMGVFVIAVDMDINAPGFLYVDDYAVISTVDTPQVMRYAERCGIDGILTIASDRPVITAAAVTQKMGLAGIDGQTALLATNKAYMRDALLAHGVPIPAYYKAANYSAFIDAVHHFSERCIVKPADNSGSRGVVLIDDLTDQGMIDAAYAHSRKNSYSGEIVIEEFMRGQEVSVESLSVDGTVHVVAMTDKLTTGAPHFVEMGHSEPSQLPPETQEAIIAVTQDAVLAVGVRSGPAHTEVIVTEQGPKIVELGARLGGDSITTHLVPLSTGVDMVRCSIGIALGEKPDLRQTLRCGAAIRYFDVPPGRIDGITGIDEARQVGGVMHISFAKTIGDEVGEVRSSTDRVGFVIARSDDARGAVRACEDAMRLIDIRVTPREA